MEPAAQVLIITGIVGAFAVVVWITWRLVAPPTPEELFWRFIPHWTSDRIRKLHVIDPEMHELAQKAAHTLLTRERERRAHERP